MSHRTTGFFASALLALMLLLAASVVHGACRRPGGDDGPDWKSFSSALADAKESKRKVLVDVYTTWCGWCKKMDRDVYGNAAVREYLGRHFEVSKLDAESATKQTVNGDDVTGRDIASSLGIRSYPTTVFFNAEGEMITSVPGYTDAETFLLVLKYIHGEEYKSKSWNEFRAAKGQ